MDLDTYYEARPSMQTGDALFFSGPGLVSRLIQARTRSWWNHVGLLVRLETVDEDRVFLLQSHLKTGVQLVLCSRYLQSLSGRASWFPLHPDQAGAVNPDYRAAILRFTMRNLGRAYDWQAIVKFLIPWVPSETASYFCSEILCAAYHDARLVGPTFLSPAQLAKLPIFAKSVALE